MSDDYKTKYYSIIETLVIVTHFLRMDLTACMKAEGKPSDVFILAIKSHTLEHRIETKRLDFVSRLILALRVLTGRQDVFNDDPFEQYQIKKRTQ